jgi:hypothetical protein
MTHETRKPRATSLFTAVLVTALAACGGTTIGGAGGGGSAAGGGGATSTTTTTTTSTSAGGECVVGGCSGQLCGEEGDPLGSTCEWLPVYACYQKLGTCERDAAGQCGWRQTPELTECVAAGGKLPASGQCVRNAGDACSSDDDCVAGGCGGELCYNPAQSGGASTCDCTTPVGPSCGCVSGTCAWWTSP